MDYQKFIQAAQQLEQAAADRRHTRSIALEYDVAQALDRGDRQHAASIIEAFLELQSGAARWWHELASIRQQAGDGQRAVEAWVQALRAGMGDASLLHRIGQGLDAAGQDPVALAEQAWDLSPDSRRPPPMARELRSACLCVLRGDWAGALQGFRQVMQAQPADRQASRNLIFVLERLDRHGQAQCIRALHLSARGEARRAVEVFEDAPEADARAPEFLGDYLRALRVSGEGHRAIRIAETRHSESVPRVARIEWADALMDLGRYDEATAVLRRGAAVLDDPSLTLAAELILPAVPATQPDLEQAHRRARRNILELSATPLPQSPEGLAKLERALGPNFLLPYMGDPCVEEARSYGRFAARVMQARFPWLSTPPGARRRKPGEPIRIGCATSFVNHHVVMKCFAGWLQRPDRGAFEIHLFPLATEQNAVTEYLARLVDTFHLPATSTEQAARQIRDAGLDLLVFPEIGLDPLSFRLAAMRLAPVQCVAAGHPMTSGLSTIDYFLSVAAAEPDDAAAHYTERLVTLPGMGIYMPPPVVQIQEGSRGPFDFAEDQVVYLSSQALFKYLPSHDELFARIAESVGNAVFVFVEGHYPAWTRTFSGRLRRVFQDRGLDPARHLRFLPRQSYDGYLSLNAASDVFLDPPGGFSGGMTVRDALACGLPVATLPGTLMRNRQGAGLLIELGISDTIATDLDDYVALAVRLGQEPDWREQIARQVRERRQRLFNDADCLEALEGFFRWAVGAARPGDGERFGLPGKIA